MASNFTAVPVLDFSLANSPSTRPAFLADLRHALINIGFLYLSHTPIPDTTFDDLSTKYVPSLFALPQEKKDALRMANSPHFLGYSRLGVERTKGEADQREQWDFATPHVNRWVEGQPEYLKLWGPAQVSCFPSSLVARVSTMMICYCSGQMKKIFRDSKRRC
jgi:isopenicillin N synthase-like dioxygenase